MKEGDETIGDPKVVESFIVECVNNVLGAQINKDNKGFQLYTTNLPPVLKTTLPEGEQLSLCFHSPTPDGYLYIGRNNIFIEPDFVNIFDGNLNLSENSPCIDSGTADIDADGINDIFDFYGINCYKVLKN